MKLRHLTVQVGLTQAGPFLQRILNVDYHFPPLAEISPGCRDLLSQLLVADPRRRMQMADIWKHPWFRENLPEGVAEMNDHLLQNSETFDGPGQQVVLTTAFEQPHPCCRKQCCQAIYLAICEVQLRGRNDP